MTWLAASSETRYVGRAEESPNGSSNASTSFGKRSNGVGAKDDLVVVGAVALGDEARAVELVEARLLEANGEGLHPRPLLARGQRRQPGRVDPAGEQHADRHVGDQVGTDRVAQRLAQLLGQLVGWASPGALGLDGARPGITALGQLALAPNQQPTRLQLARLGEDSQRCRDRVEREVGGDGARLDLARKARLLEHRLQLGGKGERPVGDAVIKRLDAEAIAGQQQPVPARVPERQREHPPQALDETVAVLLVEVDQHLGI